MRVSVWDCASVRAVPSPNRGLQSCSYLALSDLYAVEKHFRSEYEQGCEESASQPCANGGSVVIKQGDLWSEERLRSDSRAVKSGHIGGEIAVIAPALRSEMNQFFRHMIEDDEVNFALVVRAEDEIVCVRDKSNPALSHSIPK